MRNPQPYYEDAAVTLYHGDMCDVLPTLHRVNAIVTDPPYGETSLQWDRWPTGWPTIAAGLADSMWCFGSMRMFLDRRDEFVGWRLSQDVVWEKPHGSGMAVDRFRRVHEHALHWYRGPWSGVHHVPPRTAATVQQVQRNGAAVRTGTPQHQGGYGPEKKWAETGTRLIRSVLKVPNLRGRATHPTEKPVGVLTPLVEYACPPGGVVLDPFAGSGSTAEAARLTGRRAVLIEAEERYCKAIAARLSQGVLDLAASATRPYPTGGDQDDS
jgi:site-specific DNA-methyltransferase (adenine-specific)